MITSCGTDMLFGFLFVFCWYPKSTVMMTLPRWHKPGALGKRVLVGRGPTWSTEARKSTMNVSCTICWSCLKRDLPSRVQSMRFFFLLLLCLLSAATLSSGCLSWGLRQSHLQGWAVCSNSGVASQINPCSCLHLGGPQHRKAESSQHQEGATRSFTVLCSVLQYRLPPLFTQLPSRPAAGCLACLWNLFLGELTFFLEPF